MLNLNQNETKRHHYDEKLTMLTRVLFAVANHLVFAVVVTVYETRLIRQRLI